MRAYKQIFFSISLQQSSIWETLFFVPLSLINDLLFFLFYFLEEIFFFLLIGTK